jgi:hypothetical protein
MLDGITRCGFIRMPPAAQIHGQDSVLGRQSGSHHIPAPAIRRDTMDAQNGLAASGPLGQSDFDSVSHACNHNRFTHMDTPFPIVSIPTVPVTHQKAKYIGS